MLLLSLCCIIILGGLAATLIASGVPEFTDEALAHSLLFENSYYGNPDISWTQWQNDMNSIRTLKWPLHNAGILAMTWGTLGLGLILLTHQNPNLLRQAPPRKGIFMLIAILASILVCLGLFNEFDRDIQQSRIAFHDDVVLRSIPAVIPVLILFAVAGISTFALCIWFTRLPADYFKTFVGTNKRHFVGEAFTELLFMIPILLATIICAGFLYSLEQIGSVGSFAWIWLWLSARGGMIQRLKAQNYPRNPLATT